MTALFIVVSKARGLFFVKESASGPVPDVFHFSRERAALLTEAEAARIVAKCPEKREMRPA